MPRVTFVKAARKDNPVAKKGESYYWWKFRYGGKRFSKTRPRPSQLTQSPYYSAIRSLVEQVEDTHIQDPDDIEHLRDDIRDEIVNLRDECQGNLDNMPEQLQYAPTGELLQERIDHLEMAESELDDIEEFHFEEDEPLPGDYDKHEDYRANKMRWLEDREQAVVDYVDEAKSQIIEALCDCEV